MEPIGAFPAGGEWDSIGTMFPAEEVDFTSQFFAQCPTPEANVVMDGIDESLFYSWNSPFNCNLPYISQENYGYGNCSSSVFIPTCSNETYYVSSSNHISATNDVSMSMDVIMDEKNPGVFVPAFPGIVMGETACAVDEVSSGSQPAAVNSDPAMGLQLKRKVDEAAENAKKRPRVSRTAQKCKKSMQAKKTQKLNPDNTDEEENNIAGPDRQSSSSCSSEDGSASHETNGGSTSESKASAALNSNGKARAYRGSATDPQSLYARKRRERINERLRTLQNLVPNGTKVDISTMLEEAVHYVKFLQLQIKLLSSDDLWMYAPLAYNGIDAGLNQKIAQLL